MNWWLHKLLYFHSYEDVTDAIIITKLVTKNRMVRERDLLENMKFTEIKDGMWPAIWG